MADLLGVDSIGNWDFRKNHVQNNVDPGGSFVRGASVLLAAGPPSLGQSTISFSRNKNDNFVVNSVTEDALARAYPIGLVDNIGIGQSKGLQQIFEIGSERRYFLPGRTVNSMNLSRVMFDKGSLMKVLYTDYYPADQTYSTPGASVKTGGSDRSRSVPLGTDPGFGHLFLNLGSDLFNRPIGLLMLIHNLNDEAIGAVYLEHCFLQGHQMNINAASTLFAESVQAQFDRVVPLNMNFERLFNQ